MRFHAHGKADQGPDRLTTTGSSRRPESAPVMRASRLLVERVSARSDASCTDPLTQTTDLPTDGTLLMNRSSIDFDVGDLLQFGFAHGVHLLESFDAVLSVSIAADLGLQPIVL